MSEIEAEIRRQMLEERDRALRAQTPPPGPADPNALPPAPSYGALPPPAFAPVSPSPSAQAPVPFTPDLTGYKPNRRKGFLGGLGAVGIALAKLGSMLKFLTFAKYFGTIFSMLISMVLWSALFGWRFGVGIVFLIFIHECGHALAMMRLGYQVKAMVFIPFLGAYVRGDIRTSASDNAQIAIMGPVAGMLAGVVCGAVYAATGSPIWLGLAFFSFYINLFNLGAIPFLDGGRIAILAPPRVLLGGLIATLLINWRFPVCWLLLLFALPHICSNWRENRVDPGLRVSVQDQRIYTAAYLCLALFLGYASITTQDWIVALRQMTGRF